MDDSYKVHKKIKCKIHTLSHVEHGMQLGSPGMELTTLMLLDSLLHPVHLLSQQIDIRLDDNHLGHNENQILDVLE